MTAVINRNKTIEKLITRKLAGDDITAEMQAASKGAELIIEFEKKRKRAIREFETQKRDELLKKKRKSLVRAQSFRDKLSQIDLELDDAALDGMDLKGLRDQMRRLKDDRVWDEQHDKAIEALKSFVMGADISAKYTNDYAVELSRYRDAIGKAVAYRCSDGADAGLFQLAGLERQAEQVDTRPPKKRRTGTATAAAAAAAAQDVGDTPNTE
jgi:hypothetical protein